MYLELPLGVIPLDFHQNLWCQKAGVPVLLCSIICIMVYLAILIEHQLVMDRETSSQTEAGP